MQIIDMPIGQIKPYEHNPRNNDAAVEPVAASIREFGFRQPIVVDAKNVIICGHTRYRAAKRLGLETVPVLVASDLSPEKVKAYRLADNKTAEAAEWLPDELAAELGDLQSALDMAQFGFDLPLSPDDFGDEFDLPDGDKPEIVQITFTLHERQKELIEYAMQLASPKISETFGNTNKNGNALYEVVRQWAEQKKSL